MQFNGPKAIQCLAIFILVGSISTAKAGTSATKDPYDLPKVVALENRQYFVKYDLTPQLGSYPLDAFNKSYTIGLAYTHFFEPHWGWEILNFQWARNADTGLKRSLLDGFGVRPEGILDFINWMAMTSYVYTPFYSKNLLFNQSVVHSDLSLVLTAAAVHFDSGDQAMGFGGGFISRYFLSDKTSLKLDVRLIDHLASGKNSNLVLTLNLGLSFQLGSTSK